VIEKKNLLKTYEVVHLKEEAGRKPHEIIKEYVLMQKPGDKGHNFDVLFFGNKGADFSGSKDKYLGSVANEIICHTKINVCFVI